MSLQLLQLHVLSSSMSLRQRTRLIFGLDTREERERKRENHDAIPLAWLSVMMMSRSRSSSSNNKRCANCSACATIPANILLLCETHTNTANSSTHSSCSVLLCPLKSSSSQQSTQHDCFNCKSPTESALCACCVCM